MSGKATRRADDVPREFERAGELCLAFANTAAPRLDDRSKTKPPPALGNYGDLVDWGRRMGVLEDLDAERLTRAAAQRPEDAAVAFTRALSLRASLVRIFTAVAFGKPAASGDLDTLNGALRAALPWRRLAGRGKSFHWQWDGDEEALDRMLWPVVASELLLSDDLRWLRQCAGARCPRLFVDRGSRRRKWCDMNTCGSRPKGRALATYALQGRGHTQERSAHRVPLPGPLSANRHRPTRRESRAPVRRHGGARL